MNRVGLVTALGAALVASCSTPTSTSPVQLNLDRPVDIAFACYGEMRVTGGRPTSDPADPIIATAQPATACETRSPKLTSDPQVPPAGQEALTSIPSWYGFILQSASGTVAVAQWPSATSEDFANGAALVSVLDADPLTPGKNAISIGEDPIAIATDKSGCYEVTANAGSCDLSVLDITSAVDDDPATPARVERLDVTNRSGTPILARPAAMLAEPNTTVVGNACPTVPGDGSSKDLAPSGVVYIAYPSCHLVAAVDMSDGKAGRVVAGIKYDSGVPHLLDDTELATLTCPDECPNAMGTLANGPIDQTKPRPVALDLKLDLDRRVAPPVPRNRLVIGADNADSVTIVELDPATSKPLLPQVPAQFALEHKTGSLGVTSVALSPQIAMGGTKGNNDTDPTPVGDRGQYVYAVATDNTVRVVDVLALGKECDTQVDARFARSVLSIKAMQCFPVGDPATPPRRSGAKGPGIELVGNGVPTSVTIIKGLDGPLTSTTVDENGQTQTSTIAPTPSTLIGYFALITASNGSTFVANVDDDFGPDLFTDRDGQRLSTTPALVMAHQLRDSLAFRGALPGQTSAGEKLEPVCNQADPDVTLGGANGGGPRATTAPVANNVVGGPVSTAKVPELPVLHQITCTGSDAPNGEAISELQFGAPESVRDQVFPDLRSLASTETWSLTWEGPLSQDTNATSVDGPQIRKGVMTIDSGNGSMHLKDQTQPFCAMGAELFDIVQLRGCNPANGDTDCPAGYQCYLHPDSQVATGSCMLATEASRLANACRDFLTSIRRYTVGLARSGELVLLPRKHELRTTPIDGCTTDAQCEALADYAAQNASPADPVHDQTPSDPHTWACRTDDARAAVNADPAQNKRCVETCLQNSDCDVGTICQGAVVTGSVTTPGVCMEGVTPPQACVNGPQRFDVRASEAFTVIGTRSGYIHPFIEQGGPNGACVRDPAANPLLLGRIPLQAPACDPNADPITGKLMAGGFEANPCSLTAVPEAENQPVYPNLASRSCELGNPQVMLATRDAPAIQFRNPGLKLTLVDPTYPGDQTCLFDRQGTLGRIPLVFPGYQLSFSQKAGFTPLTLPIDPTFPVKVVRGPTDSIWVLDDGDFLSTSIQQASTRGKVFRVESVNLGAVNLLQ